MDEKSVDIVIEEFEEKGRPIPAEVVRQLKLEVIELRGELKERDNLIQDLWNKTRGKQPF